MTVTILTGDALTVLQAMADESVDSCVTSPPYFNLRDYGTDGQLGHEATPEEYVCRLVAIFSEVRRVLKPHGSLWLNLGDSYAGSWGAEGRRETPATFSRDQIANHPKKSMSTTAMRSSGLKPKDLIGIPWMVAFALRSDGWWLRGDHVWAKPNGMPESTKDRPTRSHEYVFLLTKSEDYFYDHEALRTAPKASSITRLARSIAANGDTGRLAGAGYAPPGQAPTTKGKRDKQRGHGRRHDGFNDRWDAMSRAEQLEQGANLRSVWWVSPANYEGDHYAVMPDMVAEICIRGGSPAGGVVLDPFGGVGTTGLMAARLGRDAVLIEINPKNAAAAQRRLKANMLAVTGADETVGQDPGPLFGEISAA